MASASIALNRNSAGDGFALVLVCCSVIEAASSSLTSCGADDEKSRL